MPCLLDMKKHLQETYEGLSSNMDLQPSGGKEARDPEQWRYVPGETEQ